VRLSLLSRLDSTKMSAWFGILAALCSFKTVSGQMFWCPPKEHKESAAAVPINGSKSKFLPVLVNKPAGKKGIETAILVQHGQYREAENYFADIQTAVRGHGQEDHSVIIAPAAPHISCSAKDWTSGSRKKDRSRKKGPKSAAMFSKSTKQWAFGGFDDDKEITYYEALDSVVSWAQERYPSLKKVVVAGNSAGSMTIYRWAVLSANGQYGKTVNGLPMATVVSAPSNYMYLSEERPVKSCTRDEDTKETHKCSKFKVPSGKDKTTQRSCNHKYNNYGYAPGRIKNTSAAGKYLVRNENLDVSATQKIEEELQESFKTKDIFFLAGSMDKASCAEHSCAGDCSSMAQGYNRLQRMLNYVSYLKWKFPDAPNVGRHGVFSGRHWHMAAFTSKAWGKMVFDVDRSPVFEKLDGVAADEGWEIWTYHEHPMSAHQCGIMCAGTPDCKSYSYTEGSAGEHYIFGTLPGGLCSLKGQCKSAGERTATKHHKGKPWTTYYRKCDGHQADVSKDDMAPPCCSWTPKGQQPSCGGTTSWCKKNEDNCKVCGGHWYSDAQATDEKGNGEDWGTVNDAHWETQRKYGRGALEAAAQLAQGRGPPQTLAALLCLPGLAVVAYASLAWLRRSRRAALERDADPPLSARPMVRAEDSELDSA